VKRLLLSLGMAVAVSAALLSRARAQSVTALSADDAFRTPRAVARVGDEFLVVGAGWASVNDVATGAPVRVLMPPSESPDFGVAGAADGATVVIGAVGALGCFLFEGSGAAHVFDGPTGAFLRTLADPRPGAGSCFGSQVAVAGANVAVAAPHDDALGAYSGAVYLFDAAKGTLLRTIANPNPSITAFGTAMATAGTNVVVGASASFSISPAGGAAYLIDGATGNVLRTFTNPTPASGDGFGSAVAAIGNTVLVGAPGDGAAGSKAGAAYLFDAGTGALLRTFLNPDPGPHLLFGTSVGAFGDAVVIEATPFGGPWRDTAYGFDATTGLLLRVFEFPGGRGDFSEFTFGGSVVALGDALAIGATVFCGGLPGCGPCERCGPLGSCVAAPNSSCFPPYAPGEMQLRIRNSPRDSFDLVRWSGLQSGYFDPRELGNPVEAADDYSLCLFDGSPAANLVLRATAPGASACGDAPCWEPIPGRSFDGREPLGYRYRDRARLPDGLDTVSLSAGLFAVTQNVRIQGKGANLSNRVLGLPTLPLTLPARVQLQVKDGRCWEARYSTARANTGTAFNARSD
jgi:outer membrane protein assembly factor BamB